MSLGVNFSHDTSDIQHPLGDVLLASVYKVPTLTHNDFFVSTLDQEFTNFFTHKILKMNMETIQDHQEEKLLPLIQLKVNGICTQHFNIGHWFPTLFLVLVFETAGALQ